MAIAVVAALPLCGYAQTNISSGMDASGLRPPVMDDGIFTHALLDQFEGRWNGQNEQSRYNGQVWSGTDTDKLWIESEGLIDPDGRFTDGQHEVLLDHAVSPYFDLQGGVRLDLDAAATRSWAALGIQGMSLYFFNVAATAYVSDRGRFASRFKASYNALLTQKLILQPEVELHFYSRPDRARDLGSGISDLDSGVRLRYEITRKFAPYVGLSYAGRFFQSANFARRTGQPAADVRFAFGIRTWF